MPTPFISKALPLVLFCAFVSCSRPEQSGKTQDSSVTKPKDTLGVALPQDLKRSDERQTFAYEFKTGDVFGYSILVKEHVKVTRDTVKEENKQDILYRYKFRVLEQREGGDMTIEATCIGVKFTGLYLTNGSKREMSYDSDEKNEPQKQQVFARWSAPVNLPYEISLSRQGLITGINSTDELLKRLMGTDFNSSKQKSRELVRKDYNENGLKNILQLAFQRFEDRPIAIDSFWTQSWSGPLGFLKLQHTAYYTYKGFQPSADGNLAHITIRMQSKYVGADKLDTGQGIATISSFDVKGKGMTVFNTGKNRCASRKFDQNVFVKFFVEVPQELKDAAQGQIRDFWLTEDASVEHLIEPLKF